MKVENNSKRIKAIKLKYFIFPRKCRCCNKEFSHTKMWRVLRYHVNKETNEVCYCQNCMHSAEEILNEIDTDEFPFGIAFVDDFLIDKKDYSRMLEAREKKHKEILKAM